MMIFGFSQTVINLTTDLLMTILGEIDLDLKKEVSKEFWFNIEKPKNVKLHLTYGLIE